MFFLLIRRYSKLKRRPERDTFFLWPFHSVTTTGHSWTGNDVLVKLRAPSCLYLPQAILTWLASSAGWADTVAPCTFSRFSLYVWIFLIWNYSWVQTKFLVLETSIFKSVSLISILTSVDLQQKVTYFSSKMSLFGNNKELQFGTRGFNGKSPANREKQRGEMLFYEFGRGSCKRGVHWLKLKVGSTVTFPWLSCGRLP